MEEEEETKNDLTKITVRIANSLPCLGRAEIEKAIYLRLSSLVISGK